VRPETEVIYREPLGRGQSVTIRHTDPLPTRKERRQMAKQAKRTAKKTARKSNKQAKQARRAPESVAA
jgi:hypothetical protein